MHHGHHRRTHNHNHHLLHNFRHLMEDRKRRQKERRKERKHKKAYNKKSRHQQWTKTKKKLKSFLKKPFATHQGRDQKIIRRKMRQERNLKIKKNIAAFLHNPLYVFRKTSSERKLQARYRKEMKELFRKRLKRFYEDPFASLRTPDDIALIKSKIRKNRIRKFKRTFRDFFQSIKNTLHSPELRQKHILSFSISTSYYVLSFLLFFAIYQLVTIFISNSFNIPALWNYCEVKFPLRDFSDLWTRRALVTIFAAGPVVCLLLALLFLRLFLNESSKTHFLSLFFTWGMINGANLFLGAYIVGMITRTGFIYTSEWIFMSNMFDVEEILFSLIAFLLMIIIGKYLIRAFFMSSFSATLIRPSNKKLYILSTVFLPWLVGSAILFLLMAPRFPLKVVLLLFTTLIPVINVLFHINDSTSKNVVIQSKSKPSLQHIILIILICTLALYRIGLHAYIRM